MAKNGSHGLYSTAALCRASACRYRAAFMLSRKSRWIASVVMATHVKRIL
jgi:hypothetical protein